METQWEHHGGDQKQDILQYVSRSIRRDITMHNGASLMNGVPFLKVAPLLLPPPDVTATPSFTSLSRVFAGEV